MPDDNEQLMHSVPVQFRMQKAHVSYITDNMTSRLDRGSLNMTARRIMETILDSPELRNKVIEIWETVG